MANNRGNCVKGFIGSNRVCLNIIIFHPYSEESWSRGTVPALGSECPLFESQKSFASPYSKLPNRSFQRKIL